MVDNVNPTSQFHPYQPETSKPQEGSASRSGLGGILNRVGIDRSKIDAMSDRLRNTNVRGQLSKAQDAARNHSGMVLGGLAALAIGAGLMRRRSMR